MKTRTISIIFSVILICGLIFLVQKNLSCQSSQMNVGNEASQGSIVSIPAPSVFPDISPLFSDMWGDPEYVVLEDIPEGIMKHFLGQPVLTDTEIFLPVPKSQPGVLIFDKRGRLKQHIRLKTNPGFDISNILIYPESQEILVGDNGRKIISVYDLSGQHKEDRHVGFHFMSFTYSPELKRYIFYLVSDGTVATAADPPDAITITDINFNVLYTHFPLSSRPLQAPFFTEDRFRAGDGLVYYNPDFSDQIYSIDFQGSVNLILDLQIADAGYYDRVDSLLMQVNNFDYLMKLKRSLCIDYFVAKDDYIVTGNIPGKINRDLIVNRSKHQGLLIGHRLPMSNFGDQFNFGYSRPDFAVNDDFLYFLPAADFNKLMQFIAAPGTTNHLPEFLESNQWLLMIFNPNEEVLFPGIEKPDQDSKVSFNLYPNPASETVNIEVTAAHKSVRIDVFATDGTLRFTESFKEKDAGKATKINIADWNSGAYVVKCTTPDEVYARTLMVQ